MLVPHTRAQQDWAIREPKPQKKIKGPRSVKQDIYPDVTSDLTRLSHHLKNLATINTKPPKGPNIC